MGLHHFGLAPSACPHRLRLRIESGAAAPPNGGLPTGRHGPPSPNDHPAWSPPPGPGPWPGTTPATRPGRPAGPVSTCSVPGSPPPAGTLALDQRPCRPAGPRRRRRRDAGHAAALGCGRSSCEPGTANAAPSLRVRPDAGRRPRRPRTAAARRPLRPAGAARHRATRGPARRGQRGGSAADTRACPAGHLEAPDAWTPDTWMLDVRSTGWTDIPTADRTRRTGQRPAWPASGHPRTGDTRWAARPRPGHGAWGRSATQDGSAVAAPALRP
jgi:hypothetical protein